MAAPDTVDAVIVGADRVPHPGLFEFKHLAQPVAVRWEDQPAGRLAVRNQRDFTSLADLTATWVLEADGEPIASGATRRLETPPGGEDILTLDLPPRAGGDDREHFLSVRFALAESTSWAPAGHEVARTQLDRERPARDFAFNETRGGRDARSPSPPPLEIVEDDEDVRVRGEGFDVAFSAAEGRMTGLTWGNNRVLTAGPRLQIWRGATDNDGIKGWTGQRRKPLGRWRAAGIDRPSFLAPTLAAARSGDAAVVTIVQTIACEAAPEAVLHTHVYEIGPDGHVLVRNHFRVDPALADLPRLGVTMTLPDDFEALDWYGLGPLDTYIDRDRAAIVGRWSGTVTGQYVDYAVPQEHGNKTGLRWIELAGEAARVRFTPSKPCEGSATRFTPDDLFAATHTTELTPRREVIVNLDIAQRGLGTGSCGPDTLERYQIRAGHHRLDFEIAPGARQKPL